MAGLTWNEPRYVALWSPGVCLISLLGYSSVFRPWLISPRESADSLKVILSLLFRIFGNIAFLLDLIFFDCIFFYWQKTL